MSKLAKMIAANLAAGMSPTEAATRAQSEESAQSVGVILADTLASWVQALTIASGFPSDIVARVVRHLEHDGVTVVASGSKRHAASGGGAAGTRTSGNDWLALGVTRVRIGKNPLERGTGYDVPVTKWAQVLRAAAKFASENGGFKTNAPDAKPIKITDDSPVNDFTGASSAALILRQNRSIAPFVALYDGRTWRMRDDVAETLAK